MIPHNINDSARYDLFRTMSSISRNFMIPRDVNVSRHFIIPRDANNLAVYHFLWSMFLIPYDINNSTQFQ